MSLPMYDRVDETGKPIDLRLTRPTMMWQRAGDADIDTSAYYLVKTNAGEWRDMEWCVAKGAMVNFWLRPEFVRGRALWVAKITDPDSF